MVPTKLSEDAGPPVPVTILGGGIGGLTLANALQRLDIEFELYEQAPELTEVGAGIGLTPGVMDLYDAIGLGDDLRAIGTPVRQMIFASPNLHIRRRMRTRPEALCVHRAELIDALHRRLPRERLHLSKRAVDLASREGEATITFADGTSVSSSCVVAADGIHSMVRKRLFPEIEVRYIHQTIWRGTTASALPADIADAYVEIWGHGLRFITVPFRDRVFWLAVQQAGPGGRDDQTTQKDDLVARFNCYHPLLKDLIRGSENLIRNDMADLGTARRSWWQGRVGFLGDAIHATTPNLAQGGCQAIEDAVCLALCLKSFGADVPRAFATYQGMRQKKVDFVVRTSWMMGRAAHSRNPVLHHGYRALLERSPEAFVRRQERRLNDLSYLRSVDASGVVGAAAG